MASRRRLSGLKKGRIPVAAEPLVYTAQDVARFCEVDLKTIHHWADAGKIPHHRTEGRHLRFRRNHVVQFLRAHGYPLHAMIVTATPTIFFAEKELAQADEMTKKLTSRFHVRRFDHAILVIARMVAAEPDAVVLSLDDPTWTGADAIAALKGDPTTRWPILAVVADVAHAAALDQAGADLVVTDRARLPNELAKALGVD